MMTILAGIGELVDNWLQIAPTGQPPYYRHRTAALALSRRRATFRNPAVFIEDCYEQIHKNWLAAVDAGYTNPSQENWRWKRHLELSSANKSPELLLERAIVRACGNDWSNQMPTASGLVGAATDKRAAVDIVFREDQRKFSLIELKVNSDNPLFAGIEILMYGLLLVWSRNNCETLKYNVSTQPVLAAETVTLTTLAPANYYRNLDLTDFASALNTGLVQFGDRNDIALNFEYCALGPSYSDLLDPINIRSAIVERHWIYRQ